LFNILGIESNKSTKVVRRTLRLEMQFSKIIKKVLESLIEIVM